MSRKKKDETLLNEDIRAEKVRCIGDDGTQYGIVSRDDALNLAYQKGLDLVLIAPNANPPVCKIMDYGKFKYQQEKKQKEAKKKQKIIDVKEVKFSVKIAQNDINYKVRQVRDFLQKGKHVKLRVFLRGREMAHPEAGVEVLEKIIPLIEDIATIEKKPHIEGRYVNMLAIPKKEKSKK